MTVQILADKPIVTREQDALGYWPFATAIAQGLRARASGEGFVVGIQAKWGMGKTSAVNLIVSAIQSEESALNNDDKTKIIKFNPWQLSGLDKLSRGYLAILGQAIGESIEEQQSKWKFWKAKGASELIGNVTALGAAAATGGAAVPFMTVIKGGVASALSLGDQVKEARNLDAISAQVKASLSSLTGRIIIVLDDLDRLKPDDLIDVLTLVKTFGDLPNVIHLLAYDREIVEKNINIVLPNAADPSYLQKIVQIEFDLPFPRRAGLVSLLNEKIGPIFAEVKTGEAWTEGWRVAFRNYLKSPRDVVKLHNALSVIWPGVTSDVYPPDLIAIELFRLFDRSLFNLILRNRDLLVGDEFDFGGEKIEELAALIKEGRSFEVQRLVAAMFPRLEKSLVSVGSSNRPKSISEGRQIGSDAGFDAYFRMEISAAVVSVAAVEEIKAHIDDSDFLRDAFVNAASQSDEYLSSLFDEFIDVIEDIEVLAIGTLRGLAEGGGAILESAGQSRSGFFLIDNSQRMSIAISKILDRLQVEDWYDELSAIISDTNCNISTCAFILAKVGEPIALVYTDKSERRRGNLDDDRIQALADGLGQRVKAEFEGGNLFERPELWMLLKIWGQSSLGDDLPRILDDVARDPDHAKAIAFSAMNIRSESVDGYVLRMDRLPPEYIYNCANLAEIIEGHLERSKYSENDRQNLQRFVESVAILTRGEIPEYR